MKEKYEGYKKFLLTLFGGTAENWPLNDEIVEKIEDLLRSLSNREEEVIRLRFGLKNGTQFTLKDIGEHFHISRVRVHQIEAQALRKLRHPARSRSLRVYFQKTSEEKFEDLVEENAHLRARVAEYEKLIGEIRAILNKRR